MPKDNTPPVQLDIEQFGTFAFQQLEVQPLSPPGVCRNPSCSKPFAPTRAWQVYCSTACRKQGEEEFRRVGAMAAPALLAWRLGKYETDETPLKDLGRAGRRYVSQLQSTWLADRNFRAKGTL